MKDVLGIILKERNYGESSKILDVFTKEYGIIGVISKGSKKIKSTLSGVSTKMTYGVFHIYYKENKLSTLTGVDIINPFMNIKNSIINFGYVEPIIINKDFTVIGGHQRLKVLKELNYEKIECIVVDLDKTQEKALNIALNKISGEWNTEKLENLLQELLQENFDVNLTGFDSEEIDNILNEYLDTEEDEFDIDEAINEIQEPITKPGDIWILGRHRLMCRR